MLERAPVDTGAAATIAESRPQFEERRNATARAVRDKLAERIGVHPSELGTLSSETCTRALANLNLQLERMHELEEQAAIDELTGVLRRGHGMLALGREVRRAFRDPDARLVAAFIDVDGLKWFNDHEGHGEGDRLLVTLTTAIVHRLRSHDLVYRYGGDEFVCILPGANIDVPEHSHPNEQLGFILQGKLRFTIGGETRELGPGDTYCIPADVPHQASTGPEGCVAVDIFSPPRADWEALPRVDPRMTAWPPPL